MPTETEELKLRITLEDGATAQLARVRQEMSQMAGGQTGQGLQNITAKTDEATKAFGSLARQGLAVGQTTTNFAKVLGPLPVTLGVLAYEFVRQLAGMKEWAGQMVAINNAARMAGVSIGQFRGIQMGLRQSGISAQEAAGMMQSLTRTLSEANRPGSAVREGLIRMAGPQFAGAMMESINKLGQMRDATDRVNYIRQMGLNVYANNFNRTHDEMQARYAQYIFLQQFGMEKLINQKKEIAHLDQRTVDNMTDEAAKQDALNEALATEEATRNRIWDIVKGSMADYELGVVSILTKIESHVARDLEQGAASRREYLEKQKAGKAPPITATPIPNVPSPATGFQHGGIVTKPTLGLVGEAGPEAIIPLSQVSGITTTSIKHTESVGENTKQLKMLNDQMEQILNPSMISKYASGMGAVGAGTGYGPGESGPGSGYGPGYSTPGSGPVSTGPAAPGTPGGVAVDMSAARMGMNPMWDDKAHPATGYSNLNEAIQSHFGEPAMQWPAQQAATGGGGIDRSAFQAELQAKPWLRDKILRIAANEQGSHPEGTQAVLESMMNRAQVRGTNLEQQAKWFRGEKGGYYAMGSMGRGALENPATRAILENSLSNTLANSNISNYATDNSSGGLAARERASGSFVYQKDYHGETFFSPGTAEPGLQKKYGAWREQLARAPVTPGTVPPAPSGGFGPFGQQQQIVLPPGATGGPQIGGKLGAEANQRDRPRYYTGMVSMGGQQYHFGTGGSGAGSLPYGTYALDPGGVGPEGSKWRIPAAFGISDTGSGNVVQDPNYGPREGVEVHAASPNRISQNLENMRTAGCFAIRQDEWPAFKAAALEQYKKNGGHLYLTVGRNGATIGGQGQPIDVASADANVVSAMVGRQRAMNQPTTAWPDNPPTEDTRKTLDRMMGKETQHDVDTNGTITIKHDAKPADAATKSKLPPFKEVPTNRQATMLPSHDGPQAPNPASGV